MVLRELLFASAIVSVCVIMHTLGLVYLTHWLLKRKEAIQQSLGMTQFAFLLIIVFLIIMVLHVAETGIWAAFYYLRSLFPDYETALYFSLGSYTTIGYGDVVLPQKWRLLGAIEGISGVLLCGVSTAFIFAIVQGLFQIRLRK
jgi:hypothetical protein